MEALGTASRPLSRWWLYFTVLVSGILLVLAFRGVNWVEVRTAVFQARLNLVFVALLIMSTSWFVRALRWRTALRAERCLPVVTHFWATGVGYFGNCVLPARAGDLIRSVIIGRKSGLGTSFVLATTLMERITDLFVLVLITLLVLPVAGSIPDWLLIASRVMGMVAIAAIAVLFALTRLQGQVANMVEWLPISGSIRSQSSTLFARFLLGLGTLREPRRAAIFFSLTVAVWMLDAAAILVVGRSVGTTLTLPQGLLLLAALGLASAAPSTPGYVGVYQFAAVAVLVPLGFIQSEALAMSIVLQGAVFVMAVSWGTIGLWALGGIGSRLPWKRSSIVTNSSIAEVID